MSRVARPPAATAMTGLKPGAGGAAIPGLALCKRPPRPACSGAARLPQAESTDGGEQGARSVLSSQDSLSDSERVGQSPRPILGVDTSWPSTWPLQL